MSPTIRNRAPIHRVYHRRIDHLAIDEMNQVDQVNGILWQDSSAPVVAIEHGKTDWTPVAPNRKQYAELEAAGRLARLGEPSKIDVRADSARLRFLLPRQAVSLLILE